VKNNEHTCKHCRYWQAPECASGDWAGQCRALPPAAGGWPASRADDWCGAHEYPAHEGLDGPQAVQYIECPMSSTACAYPPIGLQESAGVVYPEDPVEDLL